MLDVENESGQNSESASLDLEKLVAQPTWREELRLMVEEERLDPWNIDLADIADKFLARIRKFQTLDLVLPANLILAAAILLHLKSEALKFEEEQVAEEQVYLEEDSAPLEVPVLTLRTRIPPKRRVTITELMDALEDAFEYQRAKEERVHVPDAMAIILPEYNIEERMSALLSRITALADKEGLVLFSSLLREKTRQEIILTLLPLLHLAQDGKINIFQEKLFGEIFVQMKVSVT
ncbi:MAG: segregation/condensation protein A [Candidatus Burarchaeum sp.]|nr:segregation/condensation protein A [Candidatus Burarchaeum sp.]MDO8339770.1 segregation/condensation protein A [Candidatus Burarchaeum sp.]